VKPGSISSKWGNFFGGEPYFLIDAKLFPGSSGSLVISKPTNFRIENGKLTIFKEKQFVFLGIYSGEPLLEHQPIVDTDDLTVVRKIGVNAGIVWYGSLVDEIIKVGTAP
jgi:hypothetical protein